MGLDKWLKSEEGSKKSKMKEESHIQAKRNKTKLKPNKDLETPLKKLIKNTLICPNAKCKYQKTILKRQLTDDDKICPRCNKKMKIKAE
ncbi:MAG: hypothetical protein ACFE75_11210 [Candidatus Hodarchaeota archaeon]